MDIATLLVSLVSLFVAVYAIYVSRVSKENQIITSILTSLTQQTNAMDSFTMQLLNAPQMANGELVINVNHWSFILTPIVKSKELFELYKKEYASELTPKQFDLILKTFYIQVPQLIKMRINRDNVTAQVEAIPQDDLKTIMTNQLRDAKAFLELAARQH